MKFPVIVCSGKIVICQIALNEGCTLKVKTAFQGKIHAVSALCYVTKAFSQAK